MSNELGHAIGVRVQSMPLIDQTLVLSCLIAGRQKGLITPKDVMRLFNSLALPGPAKISNMFAALKSAGLLIPAENRAEWRVTPVGRAAVAKLMSQQDMASLLAESSDRGVQFASTHHTIVPPSLAPPDVVVSIGNFLQRFPFETNVFGMTRFPEANQSATDPINDILTISRQVLKDHGLSFHLASDRAISDDLWANVSGHMWASAYGIAFFEDRLGSGLNYNLTMEVGAMMMTGRRCLLLKDTSIGTLPTDIVGKIYKPVDLDRPETIQGAIHEWVKNDLVLGSCKGCPK